MSHITNPGDRPLSLAGHLRKVASLLRTNSIEYKWDQASMCNCGLLVRSIIGVDVHQMNKIGEQMAKGMPNSRSLRHNNYWVNRASHYCPLTGIPKHTIFRQLYEAGMRFEDFARIEQLNDPAVVERLAKNLTVTRLKKRFILPDQKIKVPLGSGVIECDSAGHVIVYMETWASMIEEFNAGRAQPVTEEAKLDALETRPLV